MKRKTSIAGAIIAVTLGLAGSAGAQGINPPLPVAGPSSSQPMTPFYNPPSALPDLRPGMAAEDLTPPVSSPQIDTNCLPPAIAPNGSPGALPATARPC
jgi:hypothetical protein